MKRRMSEAERDEFRLGINDPLKRSRGVVLDGNFNRRGREPEPRPQVLRARSHSLLLT
jgi:hypothetical protein